MAILYLPKLRNIKVIIFFEVACFFGKPKRARNAIFPNEDFRLMKSGLVGSVNYGYLLYEPKKYYPRCLQITVDITTAHDAEEMLVWAVGKLTTARYIGHGLHGALLEEFLYLGETAKVKEYLNAQIRGNQRNGFSYILVNDHTWR